jgi:hypothetical protein
MVWWQTGATKPVPGATYRLSSSEAPNKAMLWQPQGAREHRAK